MQDSDFDADTYRRMLDTRHDAAVRYGMDGMEPWPPAKAARLMAILTVFGNNEGFTHSPKFDVDRLYIQQLYGIDGADTPDAAFLEHLRVWLPRYEAVTSEKDGAFADAARWIAQMYNFRIFC